jgi:hypothetical protein
VERSDLRRIAVAIERLADTHERVAQLLSVIVEPPTARPRAPVRERKREKVAVTDLDRAEAKRVMRKVGRHVRE